MLLKMNVSIIGCGWLGLPLATFLIDLGYTTKGSTTSEKKVDLLTKNGIEAFQIELNTAGLTGNISEFLFQSDVIIINVPPGLRANPKKNHVAEISHLIDAIEKSDIKHVLYISSTSVFKDEENFPIIKSSDVPNNSSESARQLIEIESLLLRNINFKTTILRFGGLFDDSRHPGKHLAGKTDISNPEAPINLIHKKDCIEIIASILESETWGITLNASHPNHPKKAAYYSNYCKQYLLKPPFFNHSKKSKGKIIASEKVVRLLNYSFKRVP